MSKVTIQNFYQYRHNEVIWSMSGAFANDQGNCSVHKNDIPHSCKKNPEILDLTPDALSENKSEDCCTGGALDAWAPRQPFDGHPPLNLILKAPGLGYTCGPLLNVDPAVSRDFWGRRQRQVFRTWKATCTYSSFLANDSPVCCVSLSSFYNPGIKSCPKCSRGCITFYTANMQVNLNSTNPSFLYFSPLYDNRQPSVKSDFGDGLDTVKCTDHMCPIRVHWHVKTNYLTHWRVKLTITKYNYMKNFSNWNVLGQHPDAAALYWGIPYFNEELITTTEDGVGSVSTEILLEKNSDSFTFKNGWGFPRRVYFNGEKCEMPLPDTFPALPNGNSKPKPSHFLFLLIFFVSQTLVFTRFPNGVPWVRYHGSYKDLQINLVWPGKDSSLGVDCVGTVSASLVTYASIQALQPDLIINAGTAGGFKAKGACIGDVYLACDVAYHDRRIPIPVFDLYGVGLRQACASPNLQKELNLKVGKLSTGNSLDMSPQDEASIIANDATIKDMEGAAVAYVADLLKVPIIFVKAVTDIVDGEKPTAEEFLKNLAAVTAALEEKVTQVIDFINGKCLSDL
ncbi:COBRA-like protein 1 [Pyrus ussuriensis x Pyrus communis]|uniref:COBRA-like protein 1 n=1 Tax=Pyrus ussuriensis x Pyrus communis TaxID=2448454 RepID=A0A5N5FHN8_9ROSA|nr:COBRA-like protein 1 [Pyrus ussuriensis x Pyrus communis]